jgi:thiamine kinase-like enzyme
METTRNYQQELFNEINGLPEETLPNLLQIVRLFKEILQSKKSVQSLQKEFSRWDRLSDEALAGFEKGL